MSTLYISDLDGTLLNKDARLSKRSAEIINGLIRRGMLFTVATARSLSCVKILDELKLKLPCVQLNGVLIYDFAKGSYIDCTPIRTQSAREVLRILRKYDRTSFVYKVDDEYGIHVEFEKLRNEPERNFFEARRSSDYKSFSRTDNIQIEENDKVIYFTMVDTYARLLPIYREIEMTDAVRSTLYSDNYSDLYYLEIFSSEASKAGGMLKIKEMLKADRTVAFGDNLNDLDMLKNADTAAAVADAREKVKAAADVVIGSSYEDGVAEFLLKEML